MSGWIGLALLVGMSGQIALSAGAPWWVAVPFIGIAVVALVLGYPSKRRAIRDS